MLGKNIDSLCEDVDKIRELVENIDQDLPANLKAALDSAMCLDDHFPAVRRASKGIASTSSLLNVRASQQQQIKDLYSQIQSSKDSYNTKQASLDAMKLERTKLEAQLSVLNSKIQDAENQIADLPNVIDQAEKQIQACIKKDVLLKVKLQNAQKSNDKDQKVVAEFNQTKTRVIDVINSCLNL